MAKYLVLHGEAEPETTDDLESVDLWPNDDCVVFEFNRAGEWVSYQRDEDNKLIKTKLGKLQYLIVGDHVTTHHAAAEKPDWQDDVECFSMTEHGYAQHFEDEDEDYVIDFEEEE